MKQTARWPFVGLLILVIAAAFIYQKCGDNGKGRVIKQLEREYQLYKLEKQVEITLLAESIEEKGRILEEREKTIQEIRENRQEIKKILENIKITTREELANSKVGRVKLLDEIGKRDTLITGLRLEIETYQGEISQLKLQIGSLKGLAGDWERLYLKEHGLRKAAERAKNGIKSVALRSELFTVCFGGGYTAGGKFAVGIFAGVNLRGLIQRLRIF